MATTDKTDTTKKKRTSSGTSRKRSSSSKKKSSRTSKKTASTAKKRSTAAKRNSSKAAEEIKLTEQTSEDVKEQTQDDNQEILHHDPFVPARSSPHACVKEHARRSNGIFIPKNFRIGNSMR